MPNRNAAHIPARQGLAVQAMRDRTGSDRLTGSSRVHGRSSRDRRLALVLNKGLRWFDTVATIESAAHVRVGDLSVAYRSAGSGEAVVLLHGFLCDSRAWRRQLENLGSNFRVLAWDAPGAGETSDPPDGFTISDWADGLAGFLDAVGVREANLVGLSWGGLLAQEFYRLYPSLVLRLVLAGTYAGWLGSFGEDVARQRLERCERESYLPPDEFVARWVPMEFFHDASVELTDEMAGVVSDFHPAGFRLMARSLAEADTTDLLGQIAVPVLLLWGEGDRRSSVEVARRFASLIPGAELVLIPGAGHVSNMETSERFNAEVRRFCQGTQVD
jgi:pimeloyl-ACP methyl ester carboxylesterase